MSDHGTPNGHALSSAQAERRVAHLRDDVARLAAELERRYRRAVELPRRLEARGLEVGEQAVYLLQRNKLPLSAIAAAALGTGALLIWSARYRSRPSVRMLRLARTYGRIAGRGLDRGVAGLDRVLGRTLLALKAIDRIATLGV